MQALAQRGDRERAGAVFTRALAVSNDVGLLAEEYGVEHERVVGNFPQAFSHIGLLAAARSLEPQPTTWGPDLAAAVHTRSEGDSSLFRPIPSP